MNIAMLMNVAAQAVRRRAFSERVLTVLMTVVGLGYLSGHPWQWLAVGFSVCCVYLVAKVIENRVFPSEQQGKDNRSVLD